MNLQNMKIVQIENIVIGSLIATNCEGVIIFFGPSGILTINFWHFQEEYKFQLVNDDFIKVIKCFENQNFSIEFIMRPKSIKRIQEIVKTGGFFFQNSNNPDDCKFQIYFKDLNEYDIAYMQAFFHYEGQQEILKQNNEDLMIIKEKHEPKNIPISKSLILFKSPRKRKTFISKDDDDSSYDEYIPIKRPQKRSFSNPTRYINTVIDESNPKRSARSINQINLSEVLSEDVELQEALNRSLKCIDQSTLYNNISNMIDAHSPKFDSVDLCENVNMSTELFSENILSGTIIVRMEDYMCLSRNEYLSDVIIDFYLNFIYNIKMTQELRDKIYIFRTHFYTLYSLSTEYSDWNDEENAGLNSKKKRYKQIDGILDQNINIFEKDFLVIPLMNNYHWFLAIVCFPRLCGGTEFDPKRMTQLPGKSYILIFDSVKGNGSRRNAAINHIKDFLECEWKKKYQNQFEFEMKNITGHSPKVPLQSNNVDCGCFLLEFVERFFVTSPINNYKLPMDLSDWFSPETVCRGKRQEIAAEIKFRIDDPEINLPELFEFNGDSQITPKLEKSTVDNNFMTATSDDGNRNNNDGYLNNNDFNCLDRNISPIEVECSQDIKIDQIFKLETESLSNDNHVNESKDEDKVEKFTEVIKEETNEEKSNEKTETMMKPEPIDDKDCTSKSITSAENVPVID